MGSQQNENIKQSSNILPSQAHIWSHTFSFINSMSLKCAIELQIPDIIHHHGAPMTLSELVEALPIHNNKSQYIYRLMRILVHSGFFIEQRLSKTGDINHEEGSQGYLLAPTSRLVLTDEPLTLRPFLLAMLDPILINPWHQMSTWFKNDHDLNPFGVVYGRTAWEYAAHEPKLNQFFNQAMATDSELIASVILANHSDIFEGLNSVVDVGGGTGTVAKAIAKAFPNINCINFDLLHVVDGLEGSSNLSHVGGDMFQAIPKADGALLKWILHDWNDDECIKILTQCKEAISSEENGGKLVIIDMVVNLHHQEGEHKFLETQLFFDILMMVVLTGKERSEKEWAKLFRDAGFSDYKITPILGLRSLIEVYP